MPRPRTNAVGALPAYIEPMLSVSGEPFDSDEYLYEIKWDGTRTLVLVEGGAYRLLNRRRVDMTDRYPEFAFLRELPSGIALDAEAVVLKNGKSDFHLLMSREQARSALKVKTLSQTLPATCMAFDILYDHGVSVMNKPLRERRELLAARLAEWQKPRLLLSQGFIGHGKAFYREAVANGLEGIMAKRLDSKYLPGRRSDAWMKIKRHLELYCIVIGFLPEGKGDFRSLILATEQNGLLTYVGKVGTGFNAALRSRINQFLWSHLQAKPVIPCKEKGKWVEPRLVCRVSCLERSPHGELRMPVFEELVKE